jgi:hypothetical protein
LALLFLDGFEEYSSSEFLSANTNLSPIWGYISNSAAVSTTQTRTAQNGITAKSLKVAANGGSGSTLGLYIAPSTGTLVCGFGLYTSNLNANFFGLTAATAIIFGGTPATGIHLGLNAGGNFIIVNNATSATLGISAGTYAINTWYHIQVKYIFSSGAAGTIEVKVDDTVVISLTGINSSGGAAQINMIYLEYSVGASGSAYFDDLYLVDGTGAINNNYLSTVGVYTLVPNAVGGSTQMTATGAASNYLCVNDIPPDNSTTFVAPTAAAQWDSYAMSNLAGAPTQFNGVFVKMRGQKATTNSAAVQLNVTSGGSTSHSSTQSVYTGVWLDGFAVFETQPGGAAWDLATINAMEAGINSI